jgi:polyphosphate glucokinase
MKFDLVRRYADVTGQRGARDGLHGNERDLIVAPGEIDSYRQTASRALPTELQAMHFLAVDIGGTTIKASVTDLNGTMLAPWVRVPTPARPTPGAVVRELQTIARDLPPYDRVSIAFPGVVTGGFVKTAPNLGPENWKEFDFAAAVRDGLGRDVRILNDAIVQGLAVASGPGLDCVLTLGTGLGFCLFRDAHFVTQLELGQHFARDRFNYDQYVGHAALQSEGLDAWNDRVAWAIGAIRNLVNPDRILIGGGNASRLTFALPSDVALFDMTAGISGGAQLWATKMDKYFSPAA